MKGVHRYLACGLAVILTGLGGSGLVGLVSRPGSLSGAGAQEPTEVRAIADLDLTRYAGTWYEIARFPNWFQKDCVGDVTATYRLRDDGRVDVINECQDPDGERKRAQGIAKRAAKDGPASRLKVRFAPALLTWLPFVWADYWVLDLDDGYRHAAIGTPNRDYLWILSRTPTMDDDAYREVVRRVAAMGFNVERLERTEQSR